MTKKQTAGKQFNPKAKRIYFVAANAETLNNVYTVSPHMLVAVNELNSPDFLRYLDAWFANGNVMFIDSGIFNLTNLHARAHDVTMDQALALAPEEIDGFDDLWTRYVAIAKKYGQRSWGYIELDQGGRENKIRIRARLEKMGLRPIPVYHPINDGWDYFDELASQYDRICFGNIVQADRNTRLKLLATMWQRHRKYPHLWIHLLGLTPNSSLIAFPSNSADSSSWLTAVRWGRVGEYACLASIGALEREMAYDLEADSSAENGHVKARRCGAYQARMLQMNWQQIIAAYSGLGCKVYPKL